MGNSKPIMMPDSTGGTSRGSGTSPVVSFPAFCAFLEDAGIVVSNTSLAHHLLRAVGPRRLVPYVSFLFTDGVPGEARTVESLYALLELDRELRRVMLSAIDAIETQLKAQCISAFESELGPVGLNNPENFKNQRDYRNTMRVVRGEVARANGEARRFHPSDESAILVSDAIEAAPFGPVSCLYGNVRSAAAARLVAESFSANRRCLTSWLKTVNQARNAFAHFKPYVVRKQIPSVPKPLHGVEHDNTVPLYIVYVVERLLAGMSEAGSEWDRQSLRRFECDMVEVLGRFVWNHPCLAIHLNVPMAFADPYIEPRLPRVRLAEEFKQVAYSVYGIADAHSLRKATCAQVERSAA